MMNCIAVDHATLTERGQISIPAAIRKAMNLRAGQKFRFARISDQEFRVVADVEVPQGPIAMLGYARKLKHAPVRTTVEWMSELRKDEEAS